MVYNSTSGYFNVNLSTDPIDGYKDEYIVEASAGSDLLIQQGRVHFTKKTYTLDEIKKGNLLIEIPKP